MIFILIVLAAIATCYYFYTSVKEKQRYFEKIGLPYKKPIFLFGNAIKPLLGKENMAVFMNRMYKESVGERVIGLYHGTMPTIILRDPELIGAATIKEFSCFHDRGMPINEEVNPLEGHLFNIKGKKWRILRNKLSPTFTSGKIKGMLSLMDNCSDMFIKDLEKSSGEQINVKNEFMTLAAHVIGSCTFGIDTDFIKNEKSDFITYGLKIIQPEFKDFIKMMFRFFFPNLDKYVLKLKVVKQEVNDYFFGLVKDTIDYRLKTGESRNDFLQLLLELREKGEIKMTHEPEMDEDKNNEFTPLTVADQTETIALTDNVLTAQAVLFLAAGFETTSTTLSFICYLLSKHHDIQEKLRNEIRLLKSKYGCFSYEALREMHYLDSVINETLRLWPPLSDLIRTCNKTVKLADDILVEKGVIISIPIMSIQRDPLYFNDPDTFRPERFLEDSIQNHTFLPFGSGPRNCIGERFARLEIKITIAKILDKFKLDTCPKMAAAEPITFKIDSFINVPKDGLFCVFTPID